MTIPLDVKGFIAEQILKAGHQATRRMSWIHALHLAVLTAFAVTQPLFDRLNEHPSFLTDSGIERRAVLALTGLLAVLLPAMVAILVWGAVRRLHSSLHVIAIFILSVL